MLSTKTLITLAVAVAAGLLLFSWFFMSREAQEEPVFTDVQTTTPSPKKKTPVTKPSVAKTKKTTTMPATPKAIPKTIIPAGTPSTGNSSVEGLCRPVQCCNPQTQPESRRLSDKELADRFWQEYLDQPEP